MAADAIFGVDLGTSKVCAATIHAAGPQAGVPAVLADPAGRKVVPAVLSFHPDGTVLVGDDAVPQRLADPRHTIFDLVRLLGQESSAREVLDAASRVPFVVRVGPDDQPLVSTRAGDLTIVDAVGFLLEHVRRFAQLAMQSDSARAVLTVPHAFSPAQRTALKAAAGTAGFHVESLVDTPVAVASAWGYGRTTTPLVTVVDFGGGHCEAAVVDVRARVPEVLGAAIDTMIGGEEIDHRLVDYTCKAFWQVHRVDLRADSLVPLFLRAAAERSKVELSTASRTSITARAIAKNAAGEAIDLNLELSRDTVAAAIADILQRAVGVVGEALRAAAVSPAGAGDVVLVGGPTRLPFLRETIAAYFGRPPRTDLPPDETAALGAAIFGVYGGIPDPASLPTASKRITAQFGSETQQIKPSEAVAKSPEPGRMGRVHTKRMFTAVMQAVGGAADAAKVGEVSFTSTKPVKPVLLEVLASRLALSTVGGFCDEILARDVPLPTAKTRVFSTGKDNQRTVLIQVCQGDSRRFGENMALGTLALDGLPPRPRGDVKIEVTFSIDTEGVLRAEAKDQATGRAQTVEIRLRG